MLEYCQKFISIGVGRKVVLNSDFNVRILRVGLGWVQTRQKKVIAEFVDFSNFRLRTSFQG